MKGIFKTISGLLVILVVIGTVTFLAMRYMDILMKPVDALKKNLSSRFGNKDEIEDDLDDIFEGEFDESSPF